MKTIKPVFNMRGSNSIFDTNPTRRQAVALFLATLANGAPAEPKFFATEDFAALQAFTEILIPTDEDPGAREAHCAHFIDFLLSSSDDLPARQEEWRRAMDTLRATGFYQASPARQSEIVAEISRPELDGTAAHPTYFAYILIKRENAFAFYTSKPGMIDTLHYRGNSYNAFFPACDHPEHQVV